MEILVLPLFYREGSVTTYVGASSGIAGTLNCGADENWGEKGGIQSVEPAYLYMDLVDKAEEYVKDHPYLGERIRITCTSGKKSIEVFDPNPVCPKGFTLFLKNGLKPKQGVKCDQFGVIAGNFTCASLEGKNLWFKITLDKSTNKRPIAGRKCLTNELEAMGYDKFGDMTSLICTFKNAPGSFPSWLPE